MRRGHRGRSPSALVWMGLLLGLAATLQTHPVRGAEEVGGPGGPSGTRVAPDAAAEGVELFPPDELFVALIADPTWPRFSAEYEWRLGSDQFDRVGQVSFGETFAFVRGRLPEDGRWEVGLHAQADAIFDMTASSFDLSNEDYFVGLTGSIQLEGLTGQLRISHTSSHVGDEYLIANGGGRESVSYETADLLISGRLHEQVRVYGGLGVLVNSRPSFDPVYLQVGAEWRSPVTFWSGRLRPVAGVDIRIPQDSGWEPDLAALLALRLASPGQETRYIDFFVRGYHGRSPEGQFFRQKVDLIGVGFRLGF